MTRLTFLQLEWIYQVADKSPVHAVIMGIAQGHRSALGKESNQPFVLHPSIWPPAPSLFQRKLNTRDSAISKAGQTAPLSIKKNKKLHKVLFFLEVYPPLKSCYYNAKLDLGFSKESKVISCPTPTGLPRELDPKCLWLFWKTPPITEIYRMAQ